MACRIDSVKPVVAETARIDQSLEQSALEEGTY